MTMNLSIKKVPEDVVQRLRDRARRNHRSLQGELMVILEDSLTSSTLIVRELRKHVRQLRLRTEDEATAMLRYDRDAR